MEPLILRFDIADDGTVKTQAISGAIAHLGKEMDRTGDKGRTFASTFAAADQKTQAWSKSLLSLKTAMAGLGIGLLIRQGFNLVGMYGEQEQALTRVQVALRNQGVESEKNAALLAEYASAMQDVTKFGDETILAAQAELITFGLLGKELDATTRAAADLAEVKKMDLVSAAELLGKAYVGETALLARYGIKIDETIPKELRHAAAIEQIARTMGGQAEAAARTASGGLTQVGNSLSDIGEEIGGIIAGPLAQITPALKAGLSEIAGFFSGMGGDIRDSKGDWSEWSLAAIDALENVTIAAMTAGATLSSTLTGWSLIGKNIQSDFAQDQAGLANARAVDAKKEFEDAKADLARLQDVNAGLPESARSWYMGNSIPKAEARVNEAIKEYKSATEELDMAAQKFLSLEEDLEAAKEFAREHGVNKLQDNIAALEVRFNALRNSQGDPGFMGPPAPPNLGSMGESNKPAGMGNDGAKQADAFGQWLASAERATMILNAEDGLQRELAAIRADYQEKEAQAEKAVKDLGRSLTVSEQQKLNEYLSALEKGANEQELAAYQSYIETKVQAELDAEAKKYEQLKAFAEEQDALLDEIAREQIERARMVADAERQIEAEKRSNASSMMGMASSRVGGGEFSSTFDDLQESLRLRMEYAAAIMDIDKQLADSHTTAAEAQVLATDRMALVWQQDVQNRVSLLNMFGSAFMDISRIMEAQGKKGAAAAKAMAIVGTTINTASAAMGIFEQISNQKGLGLAAFPLAVAAATTVGAMGAAQVAMIAAQKYHTGVDSVRPTLGPREVPATLEVGERVISAPQNERITRALEGMDRRGPGLMTREASQTFILLPEREFNNQIRTPGTRAVIADIAREAVGR